MFVITIEEIARYKKREIIRDLFCNAAIQQETIRVYAYTGKLNKKVARVTYYFIDECGDELCELYKKEEKLFFKKRKYQKILSKYLCSKYNVKESDLNRPRNDS